MIHMQGNLDPKCFSERKQKQANYQSIHFFFQLGSGEIQRMNWHPLKGLMYKSS